MFNKLFQQLGRIEKNQEKIMVDLTAVTASVAADTSAVQSAITLLNALTADITAISNGSTDTATQAALNALVTQINTNNQQLAAAVVANTPASPGTAPAGS